MSWLTFTAAERRALITLVSLVIVGSIVQLYSRFAPHHVPDYRISYERADLNGAAIAANAPARKLAAGIDPNLAPPEDLELLPGIGPGLARRIVEDREANGPYKKSADLARVKGIGAGLVENLSGHLRFP